jgi:hypothetical protein
MCTFTYHLHNQERTIVSWEWYQCISVISALRRVEAENGELKASLVTYIVRP